MERCSTTQALVLTKLKLLNSLGACEPNFQISALHKISSPALIKEKCFSFLIFRVVITYKKVFV